MSEVRTMKTFADHRRRTHSGLPASGFAAADTGSHPGDDYLFTAEQLLRLVWNTAGATMAAIGVPEDELLMRGRQLASTLNQLVRDYGVTIPDSYGQ